MTVERCMTMARRALFSVELVLLCFFLLASTDGKVRQIFTFHQTKAADEGNEICDQSVSDFISQGTKAALDASSDSLVTISVHRNGEAEACGSSSPISVESLDQALHGFKKKRCPKDGVELSKYHVEALLTQVFKETLDANNQCESTDSKKNPQVSGFLGFCDMGPDRTVPQPDSQYLIEVPSGSLPCRFYTREGVRISTLEQLADLLQSAIPESGDQACSNTDESGDSETCAPTTPSSLDLYAVPAGRVFMFAPKYVGEIFELPHVTGMDGNPLSIEVLSTNPRVFDIHNFFSESEAEQLVQKAIRERSESHRLHRSTTGTIGASVYSRRTSENAWDTHGPTARVIKGRCMSALGFDEYYESHTDGLQILRYNLTTAYTPHMDYLTDIPKEKYDYRSVGRGGNRFATILLYMSDLEESWGGQTVFTKGQRPGQGEGKQPSKAEVIEMLRAIGEIDSLEPGSWEEEMAAECRMRLAVAPRKSRAVLFYSQFPNGTEDPSSEHGGCPVLEGTKWAANLWAWNAARKEFNHAPLKFGNEDPVRQVTKDDGAFKQISGLFFNSGQDPRFHSARLYWHDQFFGELGAGESVRVNTYVSHVWNVKDRSGKILQTWTITDATETEQHFTV